VWSTVGEAALSETGSHSRNFKQVVTGGPVYETSHGSLIVARVVSCVVVVRSA